MKLSLKGFVEMLGFTCLRGWTYGFGRQPGAHISGDINTFYWRYIIVGKPPPSFKPPRPIWTLHLWLDNCVWYCHFPELALQHAYDNQPWSRMGVSTEDMIKINAAAAELRGFDPELRKTLLKTVGIQDVPLAEREPYECHKSNQPAKPSTFVPFGASPPSSESSVKPRRKVTVLVPRRSSTFKKATV